MTLGVEIAGSAVVAIGVLAITAAGHTLQRFRRLLNGYTQ